MKTAIIILSINCYMLLGIFMAIKQHRINRIVEAGRSPEENETVGFWPSAAAFIFAPFWLVGAFIRQVIIEDWK
jgi:hypothetical protein